LNETAAEGAISLSDCSRVGDGWPHV